MSATILVIEDDESVVGLLRTVLEAEDHRVEVAPDGLEGLLKLRTGRMPDLALVDLMMPDVDGLRVLRQLLEEGDGQLPLPIIVVTGDPEGAARCRELLGRADVFEKPFDPEDLLARIETHLGQRPGSVSTGGAGGPAEEESR